MEEERLNFFNTLLELHANYHRWEVAGFLSEDDSVKCRLDLQAWIDFRKEIKHNYEYSALTCEEKAEADIAMAWVLPQDGTRRWLPSPYTPCSAVQDAVAAAENG